MEKNTTSIFESFGLTSVVLSFYGSLHNSFLLLSSFSTKSRSKLDEYYKEFIKLMENDSLTLDMKKGFIKKKYFLPNDLFGYKIAIKDENDLKLFLKFVKSLKIKQGFYFNKHYMHEHLKISDNKISTSNAFIEQLHPYVDAMNKVHISKPICNGYFGKTAASLFDTISIDLKSIEIKGVVLKGLPHYDKNNRFIAKSAHFKRMYAYL